MNLSSLIYRIYMVNTKMKKIGIVFIVFISFTACSNKQPIVSAVFVDSLLLHYNNTTAINRVEAELSFWKNRIQVPGPDFVNQLKYANQLISRFHLTGNVNDIKLSDSLLFKLATTYNNKESAPYMALVRNAILQHQFKQADSMLQIASLIGVKPYELNATTFDIQFELGNITIATESLQKIAKDNDYGYQFRKSKLKHYHGEIDSSINAMLAAANLSGNNEGLKNIALSNMADLSLHAGLVDHAYNTYLACIKTDVADLHSLMGIGKIALLNDQQDSLAEKIFQFVASKTNSPDPLYQLISVAEQRPNKQLQFEYATNFEKKAGAPIYGNMYNKYLIYLYTGILNNPKKAKAIAQKELTNRSTPQTNAWYAFTLFANDQNEEAMSVYKNHIAGKPLEALEQYYMGKLMLANKQQYNAQQFFKEAAKNEFDLSPAINNELKQLIK